ncbi:MAG TPA: hypothetical protein VFV70_10945 [Hyphomonadaceae bacterium]|nr:hypothetical protein [Hyphomonadaceae bacterium]
MNQNERHSRLLLPYDPLPPPAAGGRLPPVPQLWERAKVFFARVIDHIGSTGRFAQRMRLAHREKREVLGWLEPVEKLARSCLLARALGFLLMTPQGQKLRRETPKIAMPMAPHQRPAPVHKTTIPAPGWHTIAQNWRAAMEARKLDEQRGAARAALDRYDPENWGGAFRVVHWQFPEPEDKRPVPAALRKPRRVGIDIFEPDPWPSIRSPLDRPQRHEEKDRPALILARRIEALARVIDNPEPAIMRLARYIARLPREALQGLTEATAIPRPYWLHGGDTPRAAAAHVRRAAEVYCYIEPG